MEYYWLLPNIKWLYINFVCDYSYFKKSFVFIYVSKWCQFLPIFLHLTSEFKLLINDVIELKYSENRLTSQAFYIIILSFFFVKTYLLFPTCFINKGSLLYICLHYYWKQLQTWLQEDLNEDSHIADLKMSIILLATLNNIVIWLHLLCFIHCSFLKWPFPKVKIQ